MRRTCLSFVFVDPHVVVIGDEIQRPFAAEEVLHVVVLHGEDVEETEGRLKIERGDARGGRLQLRLARLFVQVLRRLIQQSEDLFIDVAERRNPAVPAPESVGTAFATSALSQINAPFAVNASGIVGAGISDFGANHEADLGARVYDSRHIIRRRIGIPGEHGDLQELAIHFAPAVAIAVDDAQFIQQRHRQFGVIAVVRVVEPFDITGDARTRGARAFHMSRTAERRVYGVAIFHVGERQALLAYVVAIYEQSYW